MAKQATDTFTGDLPDGTQVTVTKGSVRPDKHPVVKQFPGLFTDFDMDDDEKPPPAKSQPAKAEAKAAPVKPQAKPAAGKAS
jgi:hypothetical protein